MFTLFLVLVIIVGLLLSIVVLLQAGSGGGLASMGGGQMDSNVLGGRQAVTILTKGSWWLGGIFLFLALILSVLSANRSQSVSAVQQQLQSTPTLPAPSATPFPIGNSTTPSAGTPAPAGSTPAGSASQLPTTNAPPASPTPAPKTAPKKN